MKKMCAVCEAQSTRVTRGLCSRCYRRCHKNGTIDDYPRSFYRAEELIAEAELLLKLGNTKKRAASRLGVTWDAVTLARRRLKRRRERLNGSPGMCTSR